VSRTFSRSDSVSQPTRERVLAAAKELGYRPSAIARSLSTQRTNIVGFVISGITSPYYSYVLEKFTARLQEEGKRMLLFHTDPSQEIDEILPLVLEYRVDALVIIAATLSSEMADECVRRGIPVILFNRNVLDSEASVVCCDNVEGGRLAANVLLDTGHRRPAYIAGPVNTSTNVEREKGFFDRLRERGVTAPQRVQADYTYASGYEATRALLRQEEPPDAIFCASDIIAMGAVDAARALDVAVPDDVSIIGFDDIPMAGWEAYQLTTIHQPVNRMIATTMALLRERLENPELAPETKLIPVNLVRRTSVRDLPRGELARGEADE
jgi:DNA-binding LacI/PurR family transcriptional regulator